MTSSGGPAPVLVVDIGNTLLIRDRPGAFHRAMAAVTGRGVAWEDAYDPVARAVLTGASAAEAAATIDAAVAAGACSAVEQALLEADGEASVAPGAVALLRAARAAGWRVVTATNAAAWVPPIPDEIADLVDDGISSAEVGAIKQDPQFWGHLRGRPGSDPRRMLVVGDDRNADVEVPRRAGLAALHIGPYRTIADVARLVEGVGPMPASAVGVVAGDATVWARETVVEADNLASVVVRTTRFRCSVQTAAGRAPTSVVRRKSEAPAVVIPPGFDYQGLAWVVATPDRRPTAAPSDLQAALEAEGISSVLDRMVEHERRHLISMVREAKNRPTRGERIREAVAHLWDYSRASDG